MNLRLLQEDHNFRSGNNVIVVEREYPHNSYEGVIDTIVHLPADKVYYKDVYVPYFYIKFSDIIYSKILKRGWEILYQGKQKVVGNIILSPENNMIEKIYEQREFSSAEYEINKEYINSILIWRIGYEIKNI
jgi:hypothetical protein